MNRNFILLLLVVLTALLLMFFLMKNEDDTKPRLDIVFYNVENLFDTINDPQTLDDEFLPDSGKHWNHERYSKKLADLSEVLSKVAEDGIPEVIGLCEVENRNVVEDLFQMPHFKNFPYRIIHEDSPDRRGIDVAFVYHEDVMEPLHHEQIGIRFAFDPSLRTRDILYAKMLSHGDTLHFFVNHWPSRWGGKEASEPKRMQAATVLRTRIDSILLRDRFAKIIAMGDFNDHPNNRSMTEVMNAEPGAGHGLTNLMYDGHMAGHGSYNYRGEWGMLDQFIISDALLAHSGGYSLIDSSATVFKEPWMLHFPKEGEPSPNRTYGGSNYYGGYSDHLPIRMALD